MAKDLMGYESLMQKALRRVAQLAMARAAREGGLPGSHHFYITFQTTHPNCDLDESLKKTYPHEMTIVLEHQFWDLKSDDDGFEVTLKFGGIPKYLSVPWDAVTRFHDPSVSFRLVFDYVEPKSTPRNKSAEKVDETQDETTIVSLESFRKKD